MRPSNQLVAAVRSHQAGELQEADRLYRAAIAADPADVHALHLCGVLAHQTGRNDEAVELIGRAIALEDRAPDFHYNIGLALWALARRAEATTHWTRVLALDTNHVGAHINLGNALREQGDLAAAAAHLRRAVELQPQSPLAQNALGLALAALGDPSAAAHYQRAIDLAPHFIEPQLNLALDYARTGRIDRALACVRRSLEIKETADNTALFVRVIGSLDAVPEDPGLRHLVTRAALENWGRTTDIAAVATTLVQHGGAIDAQIARGEPAWPAVASDPLLRWLLGSVVICDIALERFLTATRALLLDLAERGFEPANEDELRFACALARQCFNNEYVYATSDQERARVGRLRAASAAILPFCLAVIAAYEPLHALPEVDALLARPWPETIEPLLSQQVREPRKEAVARASIPQLTPIEDAVSRLVREQYEQNPYPRWVTVGQPSKFATIDAYMRQELPQAPYHPIGNGSSQILIAGCGTGQHSIEVARQFENARVLAVDLSTASLAYATTRAQALGVNNIEHAQADILQLPSVGRRFDMIQSVGVLHHLADPWAGWRVLLSLLRPGGVMYVGLYSAIGRRDVVAAHGFIAERGYDSTPDSIRSCRQELLAHDDGTPLKKLTMFNDFFSTSECRDLLFHVQEGRMTLPEIQRFLDANQMTLLGLTTDPRLAKLYRERFPDDRAMVDLANWHALEQDHPYAFVGMYRFWIQKPDRGPLPS